MTSVNHVAAGDAANVAIRGVFRVDKFIVPAASLDAFVTRLRHLHDILSDLPGLLQRHILTQVDGPAEFNVVTFLEWSDQAAMTAAHAVVQQRFADEGFDPRKMVADLGVRADQGFYRKA